MKMNKQEEQEVKNIRLLLNLVTTNPRRLSQRVDLSYQTMADFANGKRIKIATARKIREAIMKHVAMIDEFIINNEQEKS